MSSAEFVIYLSYKIWSISNSIKNFFKSLLNANSNHPFRFLYYFTFGYILFIAVGYYLGRLTQHQSLLSYALIFPLIVFLYVVADFRRGHHNNWMRQKIKEVH